MLKFDEIINQSKLKLNNISSEEWREYNFENSSVLIESPLALNVSKSGGHRIIDSNGVSHYIPKGWHELKWKPRDGEPHLVM